MRIIIEQALIWGGVLGLIPTICVMYFGAHHDFLKYGNIAWAVGLIGVLLFLVNLISGIYDYWLMRLFSFLVSFIVVLAISSRM